MKIGDITVEVRDKALVRRGLVRPEELNFELTDTFNNVGTWKMTLQAEHPMAEVLRTPGSGIVVSGPNGVLFSGPTIKPEFASTASDPAGTVSFEGVGDSVVLADMLAFPQPSNPDPTTQTLSHDVRNGVVETIMHGYVNANVGPGAPLARRKANLAMGTDGLRGPTIKKSARFPVLGNLLNELAVLADLGFRVVQRGTGLKFETYAITDRSKSVRLDVRNNTLAGQRVTFAPPGVTRTIVAGQGDLTERQFVYRDTPESLAAESEWGRRIERFIDQRQTDDVAELQRAGDEALAESGFSQVSVQAVPMEDSAMQFGTDWFMGDRVGVVVEDREYVSVVTGYVLKIDASGVRIGAVLGDVEKFDRAAAMSKRVQSVESRVTTLERADDYASAGHTHAPDTSLATEGLWVTVRDKSGARISIPSNAQHHADLVRMCDDRECPPLGIFAADNVNQDWSGGGAFGLSQVDSFSTEYLGYFVPEESGVYQFATDGDDASEVMLEGHVISGVYGGKGIDNGFQGRLRSTRWLVAGRRYLICYRQEEGGGGAGALLYYRTPSMVTSGSTAIIVPRSRFRRPPLWMLPQLKAATFSDWEYVGQRPNERFGGTPVAFTGAAHNWGTNWDQVSFRRTQDGMVHLRGLVGQDATADDVFTLPDGYKRPAPPSGELHHNTHYYARTGAGSGDVYIRPNGTVYVGVTSTWTDLSSIPPFQSHA